MTTLHGGMIELDDGALAALSRRDRKQVQGLLKDLDDVLNKTDVGLLTQILWELREIRGALQKR